MGARDIFGIALIVVGAGVAPVGWRWLGASWFWAGAIILMVGFIVVLNAVRERRLLHEMRKNRTAGDAGDRNYLGGTSSASELSGGEAGGDGE